MATVAAGGDMERAKGAVMAAQMVEATAADAMVPMEAFSVNQGKAMR